MILFKFPKLKSHKTCYWICGIFLLLSSACWFCPWLYIVSAHACADWISAEDLQEPLQTSRALSHFSFLRDSLLRILVVLASLESQVYLLDTGRSPSPTRFSLSKGRKLGVSMGLMFYVSLCLAAWLSNVPKTFVSYILSVSLIALCERINLVLDTPSWLDSEALCFLTTPHF